MPNPIRIFVLLVILVAPVFGQAPAGRVHNSLPVRIMRPFASTAKAMLWPRGHWQETFFLDANFLVNALDARSTMMALSECIGCEESNPILGPHPGAGAIWSFKIGTAFGENMATHALFSIKGDSRVPTFVSGLPLAPMAGLSLYSGLSNYSVYLDWRNCWRDVACAARHGR